MSRLVSKSVTRKRPSPVVRSVDAPNLDPRFWDTAAGGNTTVQDVLSQPYMNQVWIYSCITTIINNLAPLPKVMVDKAMKVLENHPAVPLMQKPNSLMTGQQFFRYLLSLLLLPADDGKKDSGGQCFVIPWNSKKDQKVDLRKELPTELYVYSDKFFKVKMRDIAGGRKELEGWEFGTGMATASVLFYPHEIIRVNRTNPYDVLKGMPPTASIISAMELDTNADIYNRTVFENDGRLSGQVTTDQYMDDKQLEQNKKEWNKQYTGMKRRMTAFMTGGMKYEQFALSQSDMQYLDQAKWVRQKIIAAYGLNRIALGDYEDINFATIREGRKMLWQDTYIPLDKLVLEAFNHQWFTYIDKGNVSIASDYSKVAALQGDLAERARVAGTMCTQMNFPPELACRIMEIPLTQEDLKKWPHLSEAKPATPAVQEKPAVPPVKESITKGIVNKKFDREAYSMDYIKRTLEPSERAYRKDLERYFVAQRNEVQDRVDAWFKGKKAITKLDGVHFWDFLGDINVENQKLLKITIPHIKAQSQAEKSAVEEELGKSVDWDMTDAELTHWAELRAEYLKEINTATFKNAGDAIRNTLKQGVADNLSPSEMAKKIKEAVHDVYDVRLGKPVVAHGDVDLGGMSSSTTIARTEIGAIASMSRYDAFENAGIKKIEWLTSHDEKVRESHKNLDGDVVTLGEDFAEGLRYPRDERGSAGEVINCRCSFVAAGD